MNPQHIPSQPMPPKGAVTQPGCRRGSSRKLYQSRREHPQRQHHNEQQGHHKRLPFRLCRQARARGGPAAQAPILIGSQRGLAERAEILWQSFDLGDSRRLSAHELASPRGGRKICVGSSSCARSGVFGAEAGGGSAGLASAGEGEVLTATSGVAVGLAATGGAVGFS